MKNENLEIMKLENPIDKLSIRSIEIDTILSMVESEVVASESINKIVKQTADLVKMAYQRIVISDTDMIQSKQMQEEIDIRIKQIISAIDEYRDKSNKLHKGIKGIENKLVKPLKEAKELLKDKNNAYINEQDEIRQAQQMEFEEVQRKSDLKRIKELEKQKSSTKDPIRKELKDKMIDDIKNRPEIILPDLPNKFESEDTKIKFDYVYEASITDWHRLLRYIFDERKLSWLDINIKAINKHCKENNYSEHSIPGLYIKKSRGQSNR